MDLTPHGTIAPRQMGGKLYYGDNLSVLRRFIADESIDLIYLDPPFNSKRIYNQIFKGSEAQKAVFKDYWDWDDAAESAFLGLIGAASPAPKRLIVLFQALRQMLDSERDTLAYLSMMAVRILELHRVLKPTGSLYLHCCSTRRERPTRGTILWVRNHYRGM